MQSPRLASQPRPGCTGCACSVYEDGRAFRCQFTRLSTNFVWTATIREARCTFSMSDLATFRSCGLLPDGPAVLLGIIASIGAASPALPVI